MATNSYDSTDHRLGAQNMGGAVDVDQTFLAVRGMSTAQFSSRLFSRVKSTNGDFTYNATNGCHELTLTTTNGDGSAIIHNDVAYYVERHPIGGTITTFLDNTTTGNQRVEWCWITAPAATPSAAATVGRFGFYFNFATLVFGVFWYNDITSTLTEIPQSQWDNPLSWFVATTAITQYTYMHAEMIYLGGHSIKFWIGDTLVHTIDFLKRSRQSGPILRVPHIRPAVIATNSGTAVAKKVSINCMTGERSTSVILPPANSATFERTTPRTLSVQDEEQVIAAFRIKSTAPFRQFRLDKFKTRAATRVPKVRVWLGKASDFALTGGTWVSPGDAGYEGNPESLIEYNIGAGTEIAWTPTRANLRRIESDFHLTTATESQEYNIASWWDYTQEFAGINGDGSQMYIVITGAGEGGANGTLALYGIRFREFGT